MLTHYWENGDYVCTTDQEKLQTETIQKFLGERSYWAKGRSIEKVRKSIENSECFGVYKNDKQVGFARVVSDFTIYAYILDLFILEEERGKGLGKWLMYCIMQHPDLKDVHRWMLGTKNAHGLYAQFGFMPLKKARIHMERIK